MTPEQELIERILGSRKSMPKEIQLINIMMALGILFKECPDFQGTLAGCLWDCIKESGHTKCDKIDCQYCGLTREQWVDICIEAGKSGKQPPMTPNFG